MELIFAVAMEDLTKIKTTKKTQEFHKIFVLFIKRKHEDFEYSNPIPTDELMQSALNMHEPQSHMGTWCTADKKPNGIAALEKE